MKTTMAAVTVAAMTALGIQTAAADHVAWSVGISSGGFSAAVGSGPWTPVPVYNAPPVYAAPAPVCVRPAPVVYLQPAPVVVAPRPVCVAPLPVYASVPVYVAPRPFVGFRHGFHARHHHPHCR